MRNLLSIFILSLLVIHLSCTDSNTDKLVDNPEEFSDYISFFTTKQHSVVENIKIGLTKAPDNFSDGDEIPNNFYDITPKTKGVMTVRNGTVLDFQPEHKLRPDTEYTISLQLNKLFKEVDKTQSTFTFKLHTIAPNFKINLAQLQSYDKHTQYLSGSLNTADYINPDKLPQILKAEQEGKELPIKWDISDSKHTRYIQFVIDSIQKKEDEGSILLSWDGSVIGSSNKGSEEYLIPGSKHFKIHNLKVHTDPGGLLSINFTEQLNPSQDFSGLIDIEDVDNLRYEVDGNILNVYMDNKTKGNHTVTVYRGIQNIDGRGLEHSFSEVIRFEQAKPEVKLISKGTILPNSSSTPLYFKTINLAAVDVRVIEIYKENVLQFLQTDDLGSTYNYNIRPVGRRVAHKTIHFDDLNKASGTWQARALNLSEFFKAEPGAIYQVEISFGKEYSLYDCDEKEEDEESSEFKKLNKEIQEEIQDERENDYWDGNRYSWRGTVYNWENRDNPCHAAYYSSDRFDRTNVLGSDLGIIVKKGTDNSYNIFTTSLLTGDIEPNATVELYDYQQQLIETLNSGSKGKIKLNSTRSVAFIIAQKQSNYAYVKVTDGNSLSMSKFNVEGHEMQKGLKGFTYTERGVYRPGDSIHLTFVLDDTDNPLPADVPVKLEVTNAVGKLVHRMISTSGVKKEETKSQGRFYYFPITTRESDVTGNWTATISVGSASFYKGIKVATVKPNRLRIKIDFDDEILDASKPISGTLTGNWLHGAIARNLKAEIETSLSVATSPFQNYKEFTFTDPVRRFAETETSFLDTQLDENGIAHFSKELKVDKNAPGMLKATFLTTLHEGGGDFSIDVYSKDFAPFSHFVGLKSPEAHKYGSYYTDQDIVFDAVTVDAQGNPAGNRKVRVQVFEIQWRWWWNKGKDNLSKYEDATVHTPFKNFEIRTNAQGKAEFTINVPENRNGRYLIRLIDENSGHATGTTTYFVRNWFNMGDKTADNSAMLIFSADKDAYKVNETATVRFPSGKNGYALVSVENGTKVLSTQWVKTSKGETVVKIPIKPDMAPNAYVNISLLQAHSQVMNDLPIRLYGVIPLTIEDPQTILQPQIDMPNVLKPKEKFTVTVSEKNKRAMTYTLAIVDDGLLDLTHFKTPNIHGAFNVKQALGVRTFDIYDEVIGAYSGSVNNIYEIGGDDAAESGKKQKANRFIPVVKYLGPFHLKAGENQRHRIEMPNYVGSVRTMVVAGDVENSAYGNAEVTTPVKKPLMVLASLPRKLSPGETVTIPVTVFAMEDKVKDVTISMETDDGLEAVNGNSQKIHFNRPDEKIVNFTYKVKATENIQKLEVKASGNGEIASYDLEFDIFNPNPYTHKIEEYKIEENATENITYAPYGVKGTSLAKLTLSTVPPMNLSRRIQYLIHYPHGCIEQTTSSGFPQLYITDITDLPLDRKREMENNVKATIQRLGEAQLVNGAFSFWPGGSNPNAWATSYAGHFMLEAQKKGYALPIGFTSSWLKYQKEQARLWPSQSIAYNSSLEQAYRLYTLALAGQPELSAMNRLRTDNNLSNNATFRLAAAYALSGKNDIAKELLSKAKYTFPHNSYDYRNYGSPMRNRAMALETLVLLNNDQQRELAVIIAKDLSSDKWLSTQETSYALLAMTKMIEANGGADLDIGLTINGAATSIKTDKPISEKDLPTSENNQSIRIINNKDNIVYATVYREGKLPFGEEEESSSKLTVTTTFYDGDDEPIDISRLRQGTEIRAQVKVHNTSDNFINDLTLSQIFPSGWEIINTSFTELGGGASGNANYIDIRDDRVYFHFDLDKNKSKTFKVKLNASYLGKYYLPGTYVDAMYDNTYYAHGLGKWVEIHE